LSNTVSGLRINTYLDLINFRPKLLPSPYPKFLPVICILTLGNLEIKKFLYLKLLEFSIIKTLTLRLIEFKQLSKIFFSVANVTVDWDLLEAI
jgi:hypothetical protein